MANLANELNAVAGPLIKPVVFDLAYRRASPFWAMMRAKSIRHPGGAYIQNIFLWNKPAVVSYSKGSTFDTTKIQLVDVTQFAVKYYEAGDTQFLEEIDVEAVGPLAVVSIVKFHLQAMVMSINAGLAIDSYWHGQAIATGVAANRATALNGLAEIVNNGTDNSWEGDWFTAYGANTRNGTIGDSLNGLIRWTGDNLGNASSIQYNNIVEDNAAATGGTYAPDLLVGSRAIWSYVLERIQPQQRFPEIPGDVIWGAKGFNILGMRFLRDDYSPSAVYGKNDPKIGNYLTSTFTTVSSPTTSSNLPASTTVNPAEVLWQLNTDTFDLTISKAKKFQFGWTGYKEAQNSTIVAGQTLFGGNMLGYAPPYNVQRYGISS
jgi:hypothetical protein